MAAYKLSACTEVSVWCNYLAWFKSYVTGDVSCAAERKYKSLTHFAHGFNTIAISDK
jgi:hypothetical protein